MKDKLRLGIIGACGFGEYHLDGISRIHNAEVVAICDLKEEYAQHVMKRFRIESFYKDYKELLAREDIDAVTLPLPDQLHKQITIDALRAGKHVLCEKPMALNLDDCREMIKVAEECGKKLMVGQVGRYTPSVVEVKKLLDANEIGEIFMIESEYSHDYSKVRGANDWRVVPEREPIIGGGCHSVDLIRILVGDPEEVFAYANNKSLTDWPIHDCTMALMKFPSGIIGKVTTSIGCKRRYAHRTIIYGTKGTIEFDNTSPTITLFKEKFTDEGSLNKYTQQTLEIKIPVAINNHNLGGEVEDFCKSIINDTPILCTGLEGAKTVSVCEAIVKSFKSGEKVKVDYNI